MTPQTLGLIFVVLVAAWLILFAYKSIHSSSNSVVESITPRRQPRAVERAPTKEELYRKLAEGLTDLYPTIQGFQRRLDVVTRLSPTRATSLVGPVREVIAEYNRIDGVVLHGNMPNLKDLKKLVGGLDKLNTKVADVRLNIGKVEEKVDEELNALNENPNFYQENP